FELMSDVSVACPSWLLDCFDLFFQCFYSHISYFTTSSSKSKCCCRGGDILRRLRLVNKKKQADTSFHKIHETAVPCVVRFIPAIIGAYNY
ncbi:MAG: hypothetical protein IJM46_04430, partial [Oscillospiraceae bacterium]|nr:hypothetical protein [Oscillospiraceae bacterium]